MRGNIRARNNQDIQNILKKNIGGFFIFTYSLYIKLQQLQQRYEESIKL